MSYAMSSRVMIIPTFSRTRKSASILVSLFVCSEFEKILSWEEKKVIEFTRSSFVLGRSGTGYVVVSPTPPCA